MNTFIKSTLCLWIAVPNIFFLGIAKLTAAPFSFAEIAKQGINSREPNFLKSSDGVNIAYFAYLPKIKPDHSLIFLHGGGAHSGAGYQHLAKGLSEKNNTAVYLMDLRGHGKSEGKRGDSPTVNQVWIDLKLLIDFVRNKSPNTPLYLGGHSSGAGLVLNYSSWSEKSDVDGYIFIAPEFGYKSDTMQSNLQEPFAKPKIWVFVFSAFTGGCLFGNTTAVELDYPQNILDLNPLLVTSLTRNMAVALTPEYPQEQFSKLDKPFGLFIGENDELLNPEKVLHYYNDSPLSVRNQSKSKIVKNSNHLSILLISDQLIGERLLFWNR